MLPTRKKILLMSTKNFSLFPFVLCPHAQCSLPMCISASTDFVQGSTNFYSCTFQWEPFFKHKKGYHNQTSLNTQIFCEAPSNNYTQSCIPWNGLSVKTWVRGGRKRLPKFKFSAKFPIGLHVILQIQIKKFENDCYIMWKIILTENSSRCNLAPLLK